MKQHVSKMILLTMICGNYSFCSDNLTIKDTKSIIKKNFRFLGEKEENKSYEQLLNRIVDNEKSLEDKIKVLHDFMDYELQIIK